MEYQHIPAGTYIDPGIGKQRVYETHDLQKNPIDLHRDTVVGCCNTSNWHENVEVLLFLEGRGRVYLEGTPIEFAEGDICIIDSGELYCVESASSESCSYFCLIVDEHFCKQQGISTENVRFAKKISDEALVSEYHKIAAAFDLQSEYRLPAVRGALLSFMVHLLSLYSHKKKGATPLSDEGLRNAIRYIRTHYADTKSCNLETLSQIAGFSKYHFLREFKRVTGRTVTDYVNAVRIEHAVKMLGEENATVSAAADALGFGNHSYFSKVFFRFRGMTPSEFLKAEKRKSGCNSER